MPVPRTKFYKVNKDAKLVDLEKIKPVQVLLSQKRLDAVRQWIKPKSKIQIHVIDIDGVYYISNGHHRAYAALELGIKQVYVVEIRSKGNWIKRKEDWCDHILKMKVVSEKDFLTYLGKKS
jgi:hypothetical protein